MSRGYLQVLVELVHEHHVLVVDLRRVRELRDAVVGEARELVALDGLAVEVVGAEPHVELVVEVHLERLEARDDSELPNVELLRPEPPLRLSTSSAFSRYFCTTNSQSLEET